MSRSTIDATAYPLSWPYGVPRTLPAWRKRARFGKRRASGSARYVPLDQLTIGDGLHRLRVELERYAALEDAVISTNLRMRRTDGHPLKNQPQPDDPGVAVYLPIDGAARCIPCDRWDRVADNLAAVAYALEALRGLDRWVNDATCRAVFEGLALPPPGKTVRRHWRDVLELGNGDVSAEQIRQHYRIIIRDAHPDRGGSAEAAAEVNRARDEALEAVGA